MNILFRKTTPLSRSLKLFSLLLVLTILSGRLLAQHPNNILSTPPGWHDPQKETEGYPGTDFNFQKRGGVLEQGYLKKVTSRTGVTQARSNVIAPLSVIGGNNQWEKLHKESEGGVVNDIAIVNNKIFIDHYNELFTSIDDGSTWDFGFKAENNLWKYKITVSGNNMLFGDNISTNGGTSWSPVNVYFNSAPTYYSPTCNALLGTDIYYGTAHSGIYKSTDLGISFSPINTGLLFDGSFYSSIETITFYNNQPVALLNGFGNGTGGIYLFNGTSWNKCPGNGIPLGSPNGGISNYYYINSINFIGQNWYISTPTGLYTSTDQGSNFSHLNLPDISTGAWPVVFYNVQVLNGKLYAFSKNDIYISIDNGITWSHAQIPDKVIIGNLAENGSELFATSSVGVYKSTDGGTTWQPTNQGFERKYYKSVKHSGNSVFAIASSGGVLSTTDQGNSWNEFNSSLGSLWTMDGFTANSKLYVFAGDDINQLQNFNSVNSYKSYESNIAIDNWTLTNATFPVDIITDIKTSSNGTYIVGTKGNTAAGTGVYYSQDGLTWTNIFKGVKDKNGNSADGLEYTMFIDQNDLYVGILGDGNTNEVIYKSNDNGMNWQPMNAFNGQATGESVVQIERVSSILYYVSDLGLHRSSDNGTTWPLVDLSKFDIANATSYVSKLINDNGRLIIGLAYVNGNTFVKTSILVSDDGVNWDQYGPDLSDEYSTSIERIGNYLYTSTTRGLWRIPFAIPASQDVTPTITSISPTSGPIGTLVKITGSNLNSPTAFNIGGANALVISNDGNTLVGMVMPGATNGAISVTTAGGIATQGAYTVTAPVLPTAQQGQKIVPPDIIGTAGLGFQTPSISSDGNTVLIGGSLDNAGRGAAWVYTRSGTIWAEQSKLISPNPQINGWFGTVTDLSADGNTAIVGAYTENGGQGGAYIFTRSGAVWQLDSSLPATGSVNTIPINFGQSVSLSADGNIAVVGCPMDNSGAGAIWIFKRNNGGWIQVGTKLTQAQASQLGVNGIDISADGKTIISSANRPYVFIEQNGTWISQGPLPILVPLSQNVAISADGNWAVADDDNSQPGSGVVYNRTNGIWGQPLKLVNAPVDNCSISSNGDLALFGSGDDTFLYSRSGTTWNLEATLHGTSAIGLAGQVFGEISGDGQTVIVGGELDNNSVGAFWIFSGSNTPSPTIATISPSSGPIGTLVKITGSNLNSPTAFSIGGASALVISNDGTTLVAMVMPGATNGAISLTTSGGVVTQGNYTVTAPVLPTVQQDNKQVPADAIGKAEFGYHSTISADGNTLLVGGEKDNNNNGAAWIYVRVNGVWTEQIKWSNPGTTGALFGCAVDLSADGNTAIVGAQVDNAVIGAAYVYVRAGSTWTLQSKLIGSGYASQNGSQGVAQGRSVSLSADGNVALVGGYLDDSATPGSAYGYGAVWLFRRNSNTWTQDGPKLKNLNTSALGTNGTLSADGNTALVLDGMVAYIYVYKNGVWVQEGAPLSSPVSAMYFGSLSADGNIALVGALNQNTSVALYTTDVTGYIFTRSSGVWSISSVLHTDNQPLAPVTYVDGDVSLSADGTIALLGGGSSTSTHDDAWLFAHQGQNWNLITKLHGAGGTGFAYQGISSQLSADGQNALIGGPIDNNNTGAFWIFSGSNIPEPAITSITVTGTNNASSINTKNGTLQMNAAVLPANASNQTVTWSVINGTGSATINTAGILTAVNDGVVTVKATATDGSNIYGTKDITISGQSCPLIAKPAISVSFVNPESPLLTSSAPTGNQWFLNGNVIGGANQTTYTAVQVGIYTVQITQGICLSPVSDGTSVMVTGLEQQIITGVYPNPAESEVHFTTSTSAPVYLHIIDVVGKPVKQINFTQGGDLKIDVTDLAAGSYIIRALQNNQTQNIHFVKK